MRPLLPLFPLLIACSGEPDRPEASETAPGPGASQAATGDGSAGPGPAPAVVAPPPPMAGGSLVPVVPPHTDASWKPPPLTRERGEARKEGQTKQTLEDYLSPGRDAWNQPAKVLELMSIEPGMILADVGAGSGYFTFRLAAAAGPQGRVYAPDIDPLAVEMLQARLAQEHDAGSMAEVRSYVCPSYTPWLPRNAVDRALFVDVHYYTASPLPNWGLQSLRGLYGGMKPGGLVHVIEGHVDQAGDPPETIAPRGEAIRRNFAAAGFEWAGEHELFDDHFYYVFQRPG
jgi:predicted methyltransferase